MFQRVHRWRKGRGAKAGEGRRDQHLLCGFGAPIWEVPQVGVREVTRQRKEDCRIKQKPWKLTSLLLMCTKTVLILAPFVLSALTPPVYLFFLLLRIMMLSVLKNTKTPVKFWFLKNYLSPAFKVGFFYFENQQISHHWSSFFSIRQWCELQTGVLKIKVKHAAGMRCFNSACRRKSLQKCKDFNAFIHRYHSCFLTLFTLALVVKPRYPADNIVFFLLVKVTDKKCLNHFGFVNQIPTQPIP